MLETNSETWASDKRHRDGKNAPSRCSLRVGPGSCVCCWGCLSRAARLPQTGPRSAGFLVHGGIGPIDRTDAAPETRDEISQLTDFFITVHPRVRQFDVFLRVLLVQAVRGVMYRGELVQLNVSHREIGNHFPHRFDVDSVSQGWFDPCDFSHVNHLLSWWFSKAPGGPKRQTRCDVDISMTYGAMSVHARPNPSTLA